MNRTRVPFTLQEVPKKSGIIVVTFGRGTNGLKTSLLPTHLLAHLIVVEKTAGQNTRETLKERADIAREGRRGTNDDGNKALCVCVQCCQGERKVA